MGYLPVKLVQAITILTRKWNARLPLSLSLNKTHLSLEGESRRKGPFNRILFSKRNQWIRYSARSPQNRPWSDQEERQCRARKRSETRTRGPPQEMPSNDL
jgi:hypothetical protein